nr:MAG TPA: hypothetical protein [Caudoviricetes sp.]
MPHSDIKTAVLNTMNFWRTPIKALVIYVPP